MLGLLWQLVAMPITLLRNVWRGTRIFLASLRQSRLTHSVDPGFLQGSSFNLVNPRHHIIGTDCVTQCFPASSFLGLSDEQILALFTRGFFAGPIFAFERSVLRIGGWRLLPARYTGFRDDPSVVSIWSAAKIPDDRLLATGTCFFGAFKLLDKQISSDSGTSSYADYGFGSDGFQFAGCHRFQIIREAPISKTTDQDRDGREGQVTIRLQDFHCNPQRNVPSAAKKIAWFHYLYAELLFADGVREVCRFQEDRP